MVEVICRVRPLSLNEGTNPNVGNIVTCLSDSIVVDLGRDRPFGKTIASRARQFYVDNVLHPNSTQIELYHCRCRDIVMGAFQGINGAILAYGATGSGKTHSMFGGEMSAAGIVYQAMQDIFEEKLRLEADEGKFVHIACTFLEVYNEDVFDLLSPSGRFKLQVLDAGSRGGGGEEGAPGGSDQVRRVNPESLKVRGLNSVPIHSMEDVVFQVERGHKHRFTAATHANAVSSRSHAIITVEVEVRESADAATGTFARVRMCDLAGSERAASTSNSGQRLAEGGNINKSLLALGTVVQALAKNKSAAAQTTFVPYRGSKLTRLLKDCLGGNCRTLMLFCISPSSLTYEESINTMLFAMQAKEIQVAAQRNEFTVNVAQVAKEQEVLVDKLRLELAALREEVARLRGGGGAAVEFGGGSEASQCSNSPLLSAVTSPSASSASQRRVPVAAAAAVGERSALQQSLDVIVQRKEELYRGKKDAEEKCITIDIRLRSHAASIAGYQGATALLNREGDLAAHDPPPVGIAGSFQEMARLREQLQRQKERAAVLSLEFDEVDLKTESTIKEIRREKQHPLLELQLKNALQQRTIVEAETLAAAYHHKLCALAEKENNEWKPAITSCVAVLKELIALNGSSIPAEAKMRAHLAIAKSTVAYAPTDQILDIHQTYVESVLQGNPLLTSQLHRSSGILCANPFSFERGGAAATGTAAGGMRATARSQRQGAAVTSPVAFSRALSSSPLTSPAALMGQIKKLACGSQVVGGAMLKQGHFHRSSPVMGGLGVGGLGAGPSPATGRNVSASPVAERQPKLNARSPGPSSSTSAAQHVDALQMNITGSAIRPPQSNLFARFNTAIPSLGSVMAPKRGSPPPKAEKENATAAAVKL